MDDSNHIIICRSEDGENRIDVKFTGDTVWLSQQQLCELYNTSKANVSEHIKHIFECGGLDEESVVRKFRTTAADGKSYNVAYSAGNGQSTRRVSQISGKRTFTC